jgi:hypothetical protein
LIYRRCERTIRAIAADGDMMAIEARASFMETSAIRVRDVSKKVLVIPE